MARKKLWTLPTCTFMTVAYHAYKASHQIAVERGEKFKSFDVSDYAKPAGQGNYFDKYTDGSRSLEPRTQKIKDLFECFGIHIPTVADWEELRDAILRDGIYNQTCRQFLQQVLFPTLITPRVLFIPLVSKIEIRKEGKLGRVYYPAPYMTNDNPRVLRRCLRDWLAEDYRYVC